MLWAPPTRIASLTVKSHEFSLVTSRGGPSPAIPFLEHRGRVSAACAETLVRPAGNSIHRSGGLPVQRGYGCSHPGVLLLRRDDQLCRD
jgi:hypothetical protein